MLHSLQLANFRSHQQLKLTLASGCTLVFGANATGKSSIVEAIHLLSTGKSLQASLLEEMISFDEELARVSAEIESDRSEKSSEQGLEKVVDRLTVILTRGFVQNRRVQRKIIELNGARRSARTTKGLLYSTVFRPEDLRLIEGSPSRRRSFLNDVISQVDNQYAQSVSVYEKTLVRRNKLLQAVRDREQPQSVLQYWNLSLLKHGEIIQRQRQDFLSFAHQTNFLINFSVNYLKSTLTSKRLEEYSQRELAAGHTLIGPHKDDFQILADVRDLDRGDSTRFHDIATYGSRGQQRLAVLWLKFCQLEYLSKVSNARPLLLLDDILSELDTRSRGIVLEMMTCGQSLITTASQGIADRIQKSIPACEIFRL